jgi:hypothetical protein
MSMSSDKGYLIPVSSITIVVVDSTSDDTGRVVVVGWEGGLRWTYTGHSKINVTTQFDPYDVVTTTAGHIIVCDFVKMKNVNCQI